MAGITCNPLRVHAQVSCVLSVPWVASPRNPQAECPKTTPSTPPPIAIVKPAFVSYCHHDFFFRKSHWSHRSHPSRKNTKRTRREQQKTLKERQKNTQRTRKNTKKHQKTLKEQPLSGGPTTLLPGWLCTKSPGARLYKPQRVQKQGDLRLAKAFMFKSEHFLCKASESSGVRARMSFSMPALSGNEFHTYVA